jgi:hypothetical protein
MRPLRLAQDAAADELGWICLLIAPTDRAALVNGVRRNLAAAVSSLEDGQTADYQSRSAGLVLVLTGGSVGNLPRGWSGTAINPGLSGGWSYGCPVAHRPGTLRILPFDSR